MKDIKIISIRHYLTNNLITYNEIRLNHYKMYNTLI